MLKIFEIRHNKLDEKEWVAAETVIHALQFYCSLTSMDLVEFDKEDDIVEVPEEKWDEYKITNTEYDENDPDDWKEMTFREFIKDSTTPEIIAGTMYD